MNLKGIVDSILVTDHKEKAASAILAELESDTRNIKQKRHENVIGTDPAYAAIKKAKDGKFGNQ